MDITVCFISKDAVETVEKIFTFHKLEIVDKKNGGVTIVMVRGDAVAVKSVIERINQKTGISIVEIGWTGKAS